MSNNISLTASMRSNLLSLQNISGQRALVQNRLASGLKVNSAVDNPSSYYAAVSLSNRAGDLNALLDAMEQAASVIKTAATALDSAVDYVALMTTTATQAYDSDAFYDGKIAAFVSDKEELLAALQQTSPQDGVIVIKNDIDFGAETLSIPPGREIVGMNQVTGSGSKPTLSFRFSGTEASTQAVVCGEDVKLSGLAVSYTLAEKPDKATAAVEFLGRGQVTDLDVTVSCNSDNVVTEVLAIKGNKENITLDGKVNIRIKTENRTGSLSGIQGNVIQNGGSILCLDVDYGWRNIPLYGGSYVLKSGAVLLSRCVENISQMPQCTFEKGSYVGGLVAATGADKGYWQLEETRVIKEWLKLGTLTDQLPLERISDFPQEAFAQAFDPPSLQNSARQKLLSNYAQSSSQLASLLRDASYKGINLLSEDCLDIRLNEQGTAKLTLAGQNLKVDCLSADENLWYTYQDIAETLQKLRIVSTQMFSSAECLGSYNSVLSTRKDFAENLINVLTEGADKLTLADMNEESANMLALQTRQQLAINSLSLASQASQSILKLF